jgi:hypothetical protein
MLSPITEVEQRREGLPWNNTSGRPSQSNLKNVVTYIKAWNKRYQFSPVLVPAGTSRSTSRRHHFRPGIQAVTRVMAYIANNNTSSVITVFEECLLHELLRVFVQLMFSAQSWPRHHWKKKFSCRLLPKNSKKWCLAPKQPFFPRWPKSHLLACGDELVK